MLPRVRALFRRVDLGWVVAAILPLIGILPTLGHGVIDAADGPYHVHRIYTMSVMLAEGEWWPRWVPYYHLGFGYPIFNFYPPGVSYLGGVMVLLSGLSPAAAFAAVAFLAWIAGSVGAYALARQFLPGAGAILAAALWTYAPSRLFEVWHQGGLAQMMAAALIPWLFYGMVRTALRPGIGGVLVSGLALAGIVLTHLPMTYITALYAAPAAVLIPAWAARQDRKSFWRRAAYTAGGLALGAALSAIFWLPMALELRYIRAGEEQAETVAYLVSRFLRPYELFAQPRPYDLTDLTPQPPITAGLVPGLFVLVGFAALLVRRKYWLASALALAAGFAVFMLLQESLDVWLAIPYFRQLRFPERLLRIGALWLALLGGSSVLLLPDRRQAQSLIIALPVVVAAALPQVYGAGQFIRMDTLTALDEIEFELTTHIWGTTSYDEYDPIWGENIPRPDEVPEAELYADDPLRIAPYLLDIIQAFPALKSEQVNTTTHRITTTEARAVRFHQYYFPGWTATLDGKPVDIYADSRIGLITVDVPAGEHTVSLRYTGTTAQRVGTWITLLSLGVAGAVAITGWRLARAQCRLTPIQSGGVLSARAGLAIMAGVVAFALANELVIAPHTDWFRHESPPDDPAYMEQAVHVSFGDTFELVGYTLREDTVHPDGWLTVTLYWRPLHPIEERYRTRVHLVNLGQTEAWAVSEPPLPHGGRGATPDNFLSDTHTMQIYDWAPPYVGRLSVQMLDRTTGEPLRLADGSDHFLLDVPIRVEGNGSPAARRLDVRLGDLAELRCASITPWGDRIAIDLYWRVRGTTDQALFVMVHGLDSGGTLIEQGDGPPLDGNYPTNFWRKGQTLADRHWLPANPDLAAVAIGLYGETGRLPVIQNGQRVPDDRLLLPLDAVDCAP